MPRLIAIAIKYMILHHFTHGIWYKSAACGIFHQKSSTSSAFASSLLLKLLLFLLGLLNFSKWSCRVRSTVARRKRNVCVCWMRLLQFRSRKVDIIVIALWWIRFVTMSELVLSYYWLVNGYIVYMICRCYISFGIISVGPILMDGGLNWFKWAWRWAGNGWKHSSSWPSWSSTWFWSRSIWWFWIN